MRIFVVAIASLLLCLPAKAVDLSLQSFFGGATVENTTVALSSANATVINPVGRYLEIQLTAASATYYYRIDGSTQNVTTTGFPVLNGSSATIKVIDGGPLALQLGAGASAQTLRVLKISK